MALRNRAPLLAMMITSLAAITGCGASGAGVTDQPTTTREPTGTSEPAVTPPDDLDGCVTGDDAALFTDQGASTVAEVAIMGDGDVGVVISYETSRNVCTWLPLADRLVDAGYRVLLYDTVSGTAVDHVVDRVTYLREQGVREIVLVGGSLGGAASIVAATQIEPPVAAVVSLSGGGIDTTDAAPAMTVPLLQVVAEGDATFADAARANDAAAAQSPAHELVVLPGQVHASAFFDSPDAESVLTTVLAFVQEHAPPGAA